MNLHIPVINLSIPDWYVWTLIILAAAYVAITIIEYTIYGYLHVRKYFALKSIAKKEKKCQL